MNPATNPTDALTLAKQLGVVHNWAQNGISWDVIFTDNSRMQAVTVDVPDLVFNKIVEMKKAEIEEAEGVPQVEEEPGEVIEPSQGEIEPADGEMADKAEEAPAWEADIMEHHELDNPQLICELSDEEILDTHGIGEATLAEVRELYPEAPSEEE